jgi:hypothetical protein
LSPPRRHSTVDLPLSDAEMRCIQADLDELASNYDVVVVGVVFRSADKQGFNGTTFNTQNLCDDPEACKSCGTRTHKCRLANYMAASGLINDEAQRIHLGDE